MATVIDEKVIRLKIENGQFKRGLDTAESSIKGFGKSLKGVFSGKSLSGAESSVKLFGRTISDETARSVGSAKKSLSVLDVAAGVIFGNIATKYASMAGSMLKNNLFGGLKDGFREYELQLNSVQTILANTKSKGEDIESVSAVLDRLNTYADQTIYNFSEMTRNIGFFTAAGVGLEESADAIEGLSNVAAAMGTDSNAAANAMYQLSQALSAGTVRLMDWKSIENAGMGGEQFQESIKRTARAHGVAVDEMIEKNGSFRESLHEGWLTNDIMIEALEMTTKKIDDYSDAQLKAKGYTEEDIKAMRIWAEEAHNAATKSKTLSDVIDATSEAIGSGWAETFKILLGDFEQARDFWTEITNRLGEFVDRSATARNNAAKAFVDLGGRTEIIKTIYNLFDAVTKVVNTVGEAIKEAFSGSNFVQTLYNITKSIRKFSEGLILSDEQAAKFKGTLVPVFTALRSIMTVAGQVAKLLFGVLGTALGAAGKQAGFFAGIISKVLSAVNFVVKPITDFVEAVDPVGRLFEFIGDMANKAKPFIDGFVESFKSIAKTSFGSVIGEFTSIGNVISREFNETIDVVKNFFVQLFDFDRNIDLATASVKDFGAALGEQFARAMESAAKFAKDAAKKVSEFVKNIDVSHGIEKIKDAFDKLRDYIAKIFSKKSGDAEIISASVGLPDPNSFEPALNALKRVVNFFTTTIPNAISFGMGKLKEFGSAAVGVLNDNSAEIKGAFVSFFSIGAIAAGAKPVYKLIRGLGNLIDGVTDSVGAVGDTLGVFADMGKIFKDTMGSVQKSVNSFNRGLKADALKKTALALLILAGALWIISKVPADAIGRSLGAIGASLAGLIAAMSVMSRLNLSSMSGSVKMAIAIAGIAIGVKLLADSMSSLDGLNQDNIYKYTGVIVALTATVTAMVIMLNKFSGTKIDFASVFAIMAMALAVKKLVKTLVLINEYKPEDLWSAYRLMAVLMLSVVAMYTVVSYVNKGAGKIKMTSLLMLIAIAIVIKTLSGVLMELAAMSFGDAMSGLFRLGIVVGMVLALMITMSLAKASMGSAILFLSLALVLLSISLTLTVIARLNWERVAEAAPMMIAAAIGVLLFFGAISAIGTMASGAMAAGALMLMMSTSILIFAAAVVVLSMIPADAASAALITLAGGLAILLVSLLALVGIGTLANAALPGLFGLALAVVAIGLGMMLFAAGSMLMSVAMTSLAASMFLFMSVMGQVVGQVGPLLLVSAGLSVFATALLLLGVGALAAGAGVLVLGTGLIVLSAGLLLASATAPMAAIALKSFIDQLSEISVVSLGKATLVVAALTAMSVGIIAFGAAAALAAVGGMAMTLSFLALMALLPLFTVSLEKLSSSLENFGERIGTIGEISSSMSELGSSFNSFGSSMATIARSFLLINTSLDLTNNSVKMLSVTMNGVSSSITSMSTALSASQGVIVSNLLRINTTVSSSATSINSSFSVMISMVVSQMSILSASFASGGATIPGSMDSIAQGISIGSNQIIYASGILTSTMSRNMSSFSMVMMTGARSTAVSMQAMSRGISTGMVTAANSARSGMNSISRAITFGLSRVSSSGYNSGYYVGLNISRGIQNGIYAGRSGVINAAISVSNSAIRAAKDTLGVKSPSRVFYQIGGYMIAGMVNGLTENSKDAMDASKNVGLAVVNSVNDIIGDMDEDFNPTITPVLDLDYVKKQASGIGSMFGSPSMTPYSSINQANTIASGTVSTKMPTTVGAGNQSNVTFNYVQNNNSPKSLDNLEIYRQTRNQMRSVKEAMNRL